MENENDNIETGGETEAKKHAEKKQKKPKRFLKRLLKFIIILTVIAVAWVAFSLIGRVDAASVIPDSASVRISVANPVRLVDGILAHESLQEFSTVPALAKLDPVIVSLKGNNILKNGILRFAANGNMELALLPPETGSGKIIAAWDLGLVSPILHIIPSLSGFADIPNLYYVKSGKNSRFEFRLDDMTLYIGSYRNLLFITDSAAVFESRSAAHSGHAGAFGNIKPSSYDAALMLSNEFINGILAEQDPGIAALLGNIEFSSKVEAGLSIYPRKIEFNLAVPLSSQKESLSRILGQRSRVPGMAENIPASSQYATILSAGTLQELYQAALVFTPGLDDALKTAESSSRMILGLTLDDLLFSWTGNEFAVFGIEGRPHPVYAIQVSDERKRQEVFDKAFKSIVLNENVRLNLDGTRIPRIEVPEFLQSLLRRWNIFVPSPYYIIHKDYFLVSESAEALLSAMRAMQRNDVLPRTNAWKEIAGGKSTASSLSLYYSLDLSVPFFLRKNTTLSDFLSLYRQGLSRMSFDKNVIHFSLSLVPGSGSGVMLVNGYPMSISGRPSNRISGKVKGNEGRVFFSSGNTAYSLNTADNSLNELPSQGTHWIISADGTGGKEAINAWIVTDRGRVTLVDANLETLDGFPVLTGHRLSSAPVAYEGKLYLCDENGQVHTVDEKGSQKTWGVSFDAALRSPPSFLTVASKKESTTYAAVYPKSFSGEIWLLDENGKAYPNWPAPIAVNLSARENDDDDSRNAESGGAKYVPSFGIGFGSPLLFVHNNSVYVAYVNQSGQLLIYDENAKFVEPFPVDLGAIFFIQPVYDGEFLWLASSNGIFFRVSMDGDVLYQNIPGFSVKEEGHIVIFDSDNNKIPEVYITGEGNAIHAYTRNFRSLENFPLPVWGRPYFIPAQGNKKAEIIGMGMSMQLYRWQFR